MAVDYDLGTARGRIIIDSSQLGRTSEALRTVGRGMIGLGALAAAGFVVAIKSAADFEKQMSQVGAILQNETAPQMARLKELALDLGSTTVFSAGEIGGAMEALAKAGIPVEDMLNGATQATVHLAAAAGDELPGGVQRAAEVISNAQKTFEASAAELEHFADVLVGSAAASTISVEDMANSFRYAGPIAHELGLSIDDLGTLLAILGDRGIKGSTAGTSLRGVLLSLTPSSAKAASAMKELGLITEDGANQFYDMHGNLKPIPEVMKILGDATKDLSEQEKVAAFNAIFQRRAMNSALILADQGAVGFQKYADAIAQIDAENVAAEKLDNLSGDFTILKNSINALLIEAGQPFQDMLRGVVQGLTDLVNKLREVDPETLRLAMQILGISGAVLITLGSLLLFASWLIRAYRTIIIVKEAITLLTGAMKLLSISFLTNPIVLIIAALVLLAALIYLAYRRSETFREAFDQAFDHVQPTIEAIVGWIQNFVSLLDELWRAFQTGGIEGDAFSSVLDDMGLNAEAVVAALVWLRDALIWLRDAAVTAFDYFADVVLPTLIEVGYTIVRAFQAAISWITGTAIPAIQSFGQSVADLALSIADWFNNHVMPVISAFVAFLVASFHLAAGVVLFLMPVFEAMAEGIGVVLGIVISIITFFVGIVINAWNLLGDNVIDIVLFAFNFVKEFIEIVLQTIRGIFQIFAGLFTGDWGMMWEGIKAVVSAVWHFITFIITAALDAIMIVIRTAMDIIHLIWDTFWALIVLVATTAWNVITALISGAISAIIGLIGNFIDLVQLAWHNFWMWVGERLSGAWQFIQEVVRNGIDNVLNLLRGLPSRALSALVNIVTTLVSRGQQLIQGLWNGAVQIAFALIDWAANLPSSIASAIGDLASVLYQKGKDLIQGLIDGIDAMLGPLDEVVGGVVGVVGDFLPGSPVKKGPLTVLNRGYAGKQIMRMLMSGIGAEAASLERQMAQIAGLTTTSAMSGLAGVGGVNNNNTTVNISIGSVKDGADLKATLNDRSTLDGIMSAVKAGRR